MKNTIDTSSLNDRLEELDSFRQGVLDAEKALADAETDEQKEQAESDLKNAQDSFDSDMAEELEVLENLRDEIGYSDFKYGVSLIRSDEFEDYAKELAEDTCRDLRSMSWPFNHIDWAAAADELKNDYSEVDYDGETYYYIA